MGLLGLADSMRAAIATVPFLVALVPAVTGLAVLSPKAVRDMR